MTTGRLLKEPCWHGLTLVHAGHRSCQAPRVRKKGRAGFPPFPRHSAVPISYGLFEPLDPPELPELVPEEPDEPELDDPDVPGPPLETPVRVVVLLPLRTESPERSRTLAPTPTDTPVALRSWIVRRLRTET